MRRGENIYHRKDKRWEGRYPKGKKANGKTKYGSVYGKTLKEVREKLYPLKLHYQVIQNNQGQAAISFNEWGYLWLQEVQSNVKQSTYANYEHKLEHYVLNILGEYSLNELDEEAAEILLKDLEKRKLKPSTIHAVFRITKQCINLAIRKKMVKENPFALVQLPKLVKNRNQALTKQEQKRLETTALAAKKGQGLAILLALHAGMRIGEISALTWEDLDFENNLIHVHSTVQRIIGVFDGKKTGLIYTSSKTASSTRLIPMSRMLKKLLLQQKQRAKGKFVLTNKEQPVEPRLLTYHFHRIREKAKLATIHFHQLRHTFATRCLESRGDIMSVSALMGHSSTQMTLDTYAGALMEQRFLVVNQMEEAIG
ncbi:tyrosine-type recombinase/integrase [Candidatus Enterococcus ferrettii]|uniref:Site-specific integrase n=1 Tax=Candidatus Enterococcus ferrettii TaxID=2815324 RepID=A0ABV0ENG4_9ENTE|nr:site-specific integrase [Enterococcus sp. 665A]MBO1341391.1 tyrosine-type recombinase/integrase [Enterococcus sp. 665A]